MDCEKACEEMLKLWLTKILALVIGHGHGL